MIEIAARIIDDLTARLEERCQHLFISVTEKTVPAPPAAQSYPLSLTTGRASLAILNRHNPVEVPVFTAPFMRKIW
jgi:hypothetical protein